MDHKVYGVEVLYPFLLQHYITYGTRPRMLPLGFTVLPLTGAEFEPQAIAWTNYWGYTITNPVSNGTQLTITQKGIEFLENGGKNCYLA